VARAAAPSRLFLQVPIDRWHAVAAQLAHLDLAWTDAAAVVDLQAGYLRDGDAGLPTHRDAAHRWGWGRTRAGALIGDRDRWLAAWLLRARGE
jgi:hypothetical protein